MNHFTEDALVEKTLISLIQELWQNDNCHINAFTDSQDAKPGRDNRGEVLLSLVLKKP